MAKGKRKALPRVYKEAAKTAERRMHARPITPEIKVRGDIYGAGWRFSSPYAAKDEEDWTVLLFDAFGTRSNPVFNVFSRQLAGLCAKEYDQKTSEWRPNEEELLTTYQLVKSLSPQSEVQAALAAQIVALHFTTMKLGAALGGQSYPDERTAATLARLAKASASLMDTYAKITGKKQARGFKQTIVVRHETHVHHHHHDEKHLHLREGPLEIRRTAYEAEGKPSVQKLVDAGEPEGCAALPAAKPRRKAVRIARGEGETGL